MHKDSGDRSAWAVAQVRVQRRRDAAGLLLLAALAGAVLAPAVVSPVNVVVDGLRVVTYLATYLELPASPLVTLGAVASLTMWSLVATSWRPRWWSRLSYRPRHHHR